MVDPSVVPRVPVLLSEYAGRVAKIPGTCRICDELPPEVLAQVNAQPHLRRVTIYRWLADEHNLHVGETTVRRHFANQHHR